MNEYLLTGRNDRVAVPMSSPAVAALVLAAFVFAAGLYFGVLLFGTREALPSTVVVCPAPGTGQVAAWPKECPREAVAP
ncbi:hypothetical protein LTV02_17995 [Nocardia yamanashiensis]|uniref:hypothetical protein n=1 Tax=Nocardia yamanashiensis TaxID=209247 RepID=UPI001E5254EB|nr:hypothetical protein [Nocardia yamanashiensis]UGT45164.1 hypothetical protein LTV02_17995 [Nocardia yamanashiensis]